jgi:hypothetical protein
MNSPNKLYEELLKEHPELKNSQEDIPKIISSLQKLNPTVKIDDDFKINLKKRLDTIAHYNPSRSSWYFGFLKYFVPVFTFWFAIFGFVYFSQDFKEPVQQEIWWFESELLMINSDGLNNIQQSEPESIMQMSDIQSLEQHDQNNENLQWNRMMLRWVMKWVSDENIEVNNKNSNWIPEAIIEESMILNSEPVLLKSNISVTSNENLIDTATEELSDEILDDLTPMLFSMPKSESPWDGESGFTEDIVVDEFFQDLSESMLDESESSEIESGIMHMIMPVEIIDEFKSICLDSGWLIQDLSEWERICILEKVSCLETDFKLEKCLIEK